MVTRGQVYIVNGNEPILLNNPSQVVVVQSGSITLFAVTVKDGVVEGTRRYLCSINQGEALFGTAISSCHQQRQILAVPTGETELLHLDRECFQELVANADIQAIAWIESWLSQLGNIFSHVTTPAIEVMAEGQARFSLSKGQTFQPEAGVTCWVHLQQGTVSLLGFEELTLTSTTIFPFNDKMWLVAVDGVQLTTEITSAFPSSDILLAGLSQLHTQLLHGIDLLDEQEAQAEMARLRDRQRLNRQVTAEALGELASTLDLLRESRCEGKFKVNNRRD